MDNLMADVCCKEFMKMVLVMAAERAVAEDWEDFQPVYERLLEGFTKLRRLKKRQRQQVRNEDPESLARSDDDANQVMITFSAVPDLEELEPCCENLARVLLLLHGEGVVSGELDLFRRVVDRVVDGFRLLDRMQERQSEESCRARSSNTEKHEHSHTSSSDSIFTSPMQAPTATPPSEAVLSEPTRDEEVAKRYFTIHNIRNYLGTLSTLLPFDPKHDRIILKFIPAIAEHENALDDLIRSQLSLSQGLPPFTPPTVWVCASRLAETWSQHFEVDIEAVRNGIYKVVNVHWTEMRGLWWSGNVGDMEGAVRLWYRNWAMVQQECLRNKLLEMAKEYPDFQINEVVNEEDCEVEE